MRKKILAGLMLLLAIIMIAPYFAPSQAAVHVLSFGSWSTPARISDSEMFCWDSWNGTIYSLGMSSLMSSPDNGNSWHTEPSDWGAIDVVGDTVLKVAPDASGTILELTRSGNNGTSWSAPLDLGLDATENDGYYGIFYLNSVLFVYNYNRLTIPAEIQVIRSTDIGATWSQNISITGVQWIDPLRNDMVFLNGKLYMTYSNSTYSPLSLTSYVIESSDMGLTWGNRTAIGSGVLPLIKCDNDTLYATYITADPLGVEAWTQFTKSSDGDVWTSPVTVGRSPSFTDANVIYSLAVSSGRVFCEYEYYSEPSVTYAVRINSSSDNGDTWEDLGNVTGWDKNSMLGSLLICGDRLHLTWVNLNYGDWTSPDGTYYRWLDISEEPEIPEFSGLLLPVSGILAILAVSMVIRKRD